MDRLRKRSGVDPAFKKAHVRNRSSTTDLQSKGPLRLLKRWRSKHDLDFGCSGLDSYDDVSDEADGTIRINPTAEHETPNGIEASSPTSIFSAFEKDENARAIQRAQEERDAAEACLVYMAVEAVKRQSNGSPISKTAPSFDSVTGPSSPSSHRSSSTYSSCLPYLDDSHSTGSSSRPLTNDSLASYRSIEDQAQSHSLPHRFSSAGSAEPHGERRAGLTGPLQLPLPPQDHMA